MGEGVVAETLAEEVDMEEVPFCMLCSYFYFIVVVLYSRDSWAFFFVLKYYFSKQILNTHTFSQNTIAHVLKCDDNKCAIIIQTLNEHDGEQHKPHNA